MAGQPRVHARLDGRPVSGHQHLAGRRQHGRAQHPLQHVRDALAVGRHDLVAPHHGLPHVIGRGGALAGEVVDLQAEAGRAARGRPAGEHERAAHAVVLGVGQRGGAVELSHAAGPQVIGALDHLGHVGRHFVGVLIGQRQQVVAHGLVDADLGLAVLVDDHQLAGLGAHAVFDPRPHLGAADAGDGALGHLTHGLLDLGQFLRGVARGGFAQRRIDQHAPVVDPLIRMVFGQFVVRHLAHGLADGAHGAHILLAVGHHLGHQRRVFAERTVGLGDGQGADQLRAAVVLLHGRAGEAPHVFKAAGAAVGPGLRCGAIELLQRRFGEALIGRQHIPEDEPLEGGVVGAYLAPVLRHAGREGLAWQPRHHVVIAEGVGHAQHLGAAVLRVVVGARAGQVAAAAGLEVKPEDHGETAPACAGAGPSQAVRRRRRPASAGAVSASGSATASGSAPGPSRLIHSITSNTGV